MSTVIVYASTHQGNTKKLVDAIKEKHPEVELIDAVTTKEADLGSYDAIGLASGIFATKFHNSILEFAAKNLPAGKKVFYMSTSILANDFTNAVTKKLADKNPNVIGHFECKGFSTFGPFKLTGGAAKGHPDAQDLADAVAFYESLGV